MNALILGTEIPGEVVAGVISILTLVFLGTASWALVLLVRLAGVVARLEERTEALAERLAHLEASSQTVGGYAITSSIPRGVGFS